MVARLFKIARVVTRGQKPDDYDERLGWCRKLLEKACQNCTEKVDVMQTPGGFLFGWLDFSETTTGEASTVKLYEDTEEPASSFVDELLTSTLRQQLREKADYVTIGFDGYDVDCPKHMEMVGTYDTRKGQVIAWTGKSYPVDYQAKTLLYCLDLTTHFQKFGNTPVLVLGCHDLNMFSPRSRASTKEGTYKARTTQIIQTLCRAFRPEVVLQHPHGTDSPNIWAQGWIGVQELVPSVHTYASAIHYHNLDGGEPRQPLRNVLGRTKMGQVIDIIASL